MAPLSPSGLRAVNRSSDIDPAIAWCPGRVWPLPPGRRPAAACGRGAGGIHTTRIPPVSPRTCPRAPCFSAVGVGPSGRIEVPYRSLRRRSSEIQPAGLNCLWAEVSPALQLEIGSHGSIG